MDGALIKELMEGYNLSKAFIYRYPYSITADSE